MLLDEVIAKAAGVSRLKVAEDAAEHLGAIGVVDDIVVVADVVVVVVVEFTSWPRSC